LEYEEGGLEEKKMTGIWNMGQLQCDVWKRKTKGFLNFWELEEVLELRIFRKTEGEKL